MGNFFGSYDKMVYTLEDEAFETELIENTELKNWQYYFKFDNLKSYAKLDELQDKGLS